MKTVREAFTVFVGMWVLFLVVLFSMRLLAPCKSSLPGFARCGIIHKPRTGCPTGFTEGQGWFEKEGGKKTPSCVNPNLPQCLEEGDPLEAYILR